MICEEPYPGCKLKIIFSAIYVNHRTKTSAYLRSLRDKWRKNPEWVSRVKKYNSLRNKTHPRKESEDQKELRRLRARLKWKNNPEFRARKYAYHRALMQTERQRQKSRERSRNRLQLPWIKIVNSARSRIWASLKGKGRKKWASVKELVGCTKEEMVAHIESHFIAGMSWSNHGNKPGCWHIDHIRPLASFNLDTLGSQREAFNYKNTRPMWCFDNLSKSSVYNGRRWYYRDHMPAQSISD